MAASVGVGGGEIGLARRGLRLCIFNHKSVLLTSIELTFQKACLKL